MQEPKIKRTEQDKIDSTVCWKEDEQSRTLRGGDGV
jgi:hypothetical protein